MCTCRDDSEMIIDPSPFVFFLQLTSQSLIQNILYILHKLDTDALSHT
jgi:hypothetical protein